MVIIKLYWYIRALLRVGVFNKEPTAEEISGWIILSRLVREPRVPEKFRCSECGLWAWRLGRTQVCDRYPCYIKSKMRRKVEVIP